MQLKSENRLSRYFARRLGEETALAGLPWQTHRHAFEDEHDSYLAGWRDAVAAMGVETKQIAQTRATLDMSDPQPASLWSRLWRWLWPGVSRERAEFLRQQRENRHG